MLAAVFVAKIGDVHRFAAAPPLCSWAGLSPRYRESDTIVRRVVGMWENRGRSHEGRSAEE